MSETLGIRSNLAGAVARAAATFLCPAGRVLRSERLESSPPGAVVKEPAGHRPHQPLVRRSSYSAETIEGIR
jgi:hypothetical protein